VPYVRSHHERYDGRGYPDGIHKENIPLVSRILAVADSFDAMTSNRPYRPTMNREYAFGELKKNASTQFDPIVVEAFLKRITM
jgi:HD-GYP domain-containing protein (c-di-GMP phosphodiesterase class II)